MSSSVETITPQPVRIEAGRVQIDGDLSLPSDAHGLIIFAHGSGSSRFSARNRAVAAVLHRRRLATLALDLLTESEAHIDEVTAEFRFDIRLLAERVVRTVDWAQAAEATSRLPVSLFGASTGAAAALIAAADRQKAVRAVVSRGGRPDLAAEALERVLAPTLFVVGGRDYGVIELNRDALTRLAAPVKELTIVSGATHLFEEAGALAEVARLAADWFVRYGFA